MTLKHYLIIALATFPLAFTVTAIIVFGMQTGWTWDWSVFN